MAGTEGGVGRPAVPGARTPDIGIKADKLGSITEGRARVLAETDTPCLKTHNAHGNATGPQFTMLASDVPGAGYRDVAGGRWSPSSLPTSPPSCALCGWSSLSPRRPMTSRPRTF